tara:strand:+ start:489 stop:971 length:483 start_codon:yes stop_codon:yes gene_type:complete
MSKEQIKDLIKTTLESLGSKYASNDAINLVFWTGCVESRYEYIKQLGWGPARSFWQVEPNTAVDNIKSYLKFRKSLKKKCAEITLTDPKIWDSDDTSLWSWVLEHNMAASVIHCRLKYWRSPKRMPDNIDDAAKMWKEVYNSSEGAGTINKFKKLVHHMD